MRFGVRPRHTLWFAAVLAAVALTAGPPRASAGINLAFKDTTSNPDVNITYHNGTNFVTQTVRPGPYYWQVAGGTDAHRMPTVAGYAHTFCVELTQGISLTNPATVYQYSLVSPSAKEDPATVTALRKLWAHHYDSTWASQSFNGSVASAAFQLAIWELVTDGASGPNLATGNFKSGTTTQLGNVATAYGLAKSWLDGLGAKADTFNTNYPGRQLVWLSSPTAQDQLTVMAVPEPTGMALMLGGLAGCGLLRRLRAARPTA